MNEVKFQAFWDRISICWTDRDFQSWVNHIALPFTLITRNGQLNNDPIESLKKISQIIRKVTVIEVSEEDTLIGSYQTQMFAGDRRVVGRYTSSAMLDYDGKTWWISSIMNALGHRDWATREHLT